MTEPGDPPAQNQHPLPSEHGDEFPESGQPATPEQSGEGRPDDHPRPDIGSHLVGPSPAADDARSGMEPRRQFPPFGDGQPGQPQVGQQLTLFNAQTSYAGPVPLAAQLAEYGQIDTTFPERLMRMAESGTTDASARLDRQLDSEIAERRRGQYAAFGLAAAAFVAAVVFGALGHTALAAIMIGVPIVLLIRALLGDAGRPRGNTGASDGSP